MKELDVLIDKFHIEDLSNELHPSIFDDNEEYDMLIVRIPVIDEELSIISSGFIITKDKSYYYNKEINEFEELSNKYIGLHSFVDKKIDKLLKSFLKYQEKISEIEENLYADKTDSAFLKNWLSLKLEILKIERVLLRTTNVVDEFIEFNKENHDFPINHYVDMYEHMERVMRSATLQLSKLDDLYSFYNAKSNDKMNKMIYILTVISGIFLPLNLVVGFFGMNTTGLPFTSGSSGTIYAISIMIILVFTTTFIVYKWRKKIES